MDILETIDKIMTKKGIHSGKDFAEVLGISPQDYSTRKNQRPYSLAKLILKWILENEENDDIGLNWLFRGGHDDIMLNARTADKYPNITSDITAAANTAAQAGWTEDQAAEYLINLLKNVRISLRAEAEAAANKPKKEK